MTDPEPRNRRHYTTGRPGLDVILIWAASLFCLAGVIIFVRIVRIGLPFILFFRLQWLIIVVLVVLISFGIAWTSRQN